MIILLVLVFAVSLISLTISRSSLFARFREFMADFSLNFFSCTYCVSHWIGILLSWIYKPFIQSSGSVAVDVFVYGMAISAASLLVSAAILNYFMIFDIQKEEDQ